MKKYLSFLKKNQGKICLVIILLVSAILRLVQIDKLDYFMYDQARNALFIKRILVDQEFRLLGIQTSFPGFYLPPFYYYSLVPVLAFFSLNPIGIDIITAVFGILTTGLIYLVGNRLFGHPSGLFSAGLWAVSSVVVELTRRAWDPSILPFFILLSFFLFYLFIVKKETKYLIGASLFYGYCLSLAFSAWVVLPLILFFLLLLLINSPKKNWPNFFIFILFLLLFLSPLFLFDLSHQFFLSNNFRLVLNSGSLVNFDGLFSFSFLVPLLTIFNIIISGRILPGFTAETFTIEKLSDFFGFSRPISLVAQKPLVFLTNFWGSLFFVFIVICSLIFIFSGKGKNRELILVWIWLMWGVVATQFYEGTVFFYRYLFLLPAPILLFGFSLGFLWQRQKVRPLLILVFVSIIIFHLKNTNIFIKYWRDINDLREVSMLISENINQERFNLATIQKDSSRWDRNSVDYRYFVESFGKKRALDWEPNDYKNAKILFVIDETGNADVLSSNIMEIREFSPQKIISTWQTKKGIIVYKLGK